MTLGERRINMCALKNWQHKFQGGVGREIMAEVLRPLAQQVAWKTEIYGVVQVFFKRGIVRTRNI